MMSFTFATTDQVRKTLIAFAVIMLVWQIVWLAKSNLDTRLIWFKSESVAAIFWLVAKIIVWVIPAFLLIRTSGRTIASQINFPEWRHWLFWGTVVGLLIAMTAMIPKLLAGSALLPKHIDYGTMNALFVAPLFEEFLFRAAIMGNLIPAFGFARANIIASICFVILHVPGWYMMGSLTRMTSSLTGGAFSIFILGLCFGWVTRKGQSFLGGSIAHCLNNFAAAI